MIMDSRHEDLSIDEKIEQLKKLSDQITQRLEKTQTQKSGDGQSLLLQGSQVSPQNSKSQPQSYTTNQNSYQTSTGSLQPSPHRTGPAQKLQGSLLPTPSQYKSERNGNGELLEDVDLRIGQRPMLSKQQPVLVKSADRTRIEESWLKAKTFAEKREIDGEMSTASSAVKTLPEESQLPKKKLPPAREPPHKTDNMPHSKMRRPVQHVERAKQPESQPLTRPMYEEESIFPPRRDLDDRHSLRSRFGHEGMPPPRSRGPLIRGPLRPKDDAVDKLSPRSRGPLDMGPLPPKDGAVDKLPPRSRGPLDMGPLPPKDDAADNLPPRSRDQLDMGPLRPSDDAVDKLPPRSRDQLDMGPLRPRDDSGDKPPPRSRDHLDMAPLRPRDDSGDKPPPRLRDSLDMNLIRPGEDSLDRPPPRPRDRLDMGPLRPRDHSLEMLPPRSHADLRDGFSPRPRADALNLPSHLRYEDSLPPPRARLRDPIDDPNSSSVLKLPISPRDAGYLQSARAARLREERAAEYEYYAARERERRLHYREEYEFYPDPAHAPRPHPGYAETAGYQYENVDQRFNFAADSLPPPVGSRLPPPARYTRVGAGAPPYGIRPRGVPPGAIRVQGAPLHGRVPPNPSTLPPLMGDTPPISASPIGPPNRPDTDRKRSGNGDNEKDKWKKSKWNKDEKPENKQYITDDLKPFVNIKFCDICRVEFSHPIVAKQHLRGKTHIKKLKNLGMPVPEICKDKTLLNKLKKEAESQAEKNGKDGEKTGKVEEDYLLQGDGDNNIEEDIPWPDWMQELFEDDFCGVCHIPISSGCVADAHYIGKKHYKKCNQLYMQRNKEEQEKMKTRGNPMSELRCEVCQITCSSREALDAHIAGRAHKHAMHYYRAKSDAPKISEVNSTVVEGIEIADTPGNDEPDQSISWPPSKY